MLQNNAVLKNKIDQLWNKFWSAGLSNPLTAIEQITYLLFMKRIDDIDSKEMLNKEKFISKFEGEFIIPGSEKKIDKKTLRWSYFKNLDGEKRLVHVQEKVFPFLKTLNGSESVFTKYMRNAVFIISKPALLVEAMSTIEDIFLEIEKDASDNGQAFQDIQGDVYEMLISEISTSGKNGQFRTPRHIIKLITELIEPQLGNKIADPACGTGGFLLDAYQYIVTKLVGNKLSIALDQDGFMRSSNNTLLSSDINETLNSSLFGYDIDVTMVRLALMNLMMHGIDTPYIQHQDTLSKEFNESENYDIIVANPPFTGSIDSSDVNSALKIKTKKTEILFIENIYNLLKIGGTAAIIIPQGVLFSVSKAFVEARRLIVEECELKAVITMPSGVFKPYAGVNTAILIFSKGQHTDNIWFYDMRNDGYSLDDKRLKLKGESDLKEIIVEYKNRKNITNNNRKKKFFLVSKQEIVEQNYDLSINKYKEDIVEEIMYEKPNVILKQIKEIENQISIELNELEEMLE